MKINTLRDLKRVAQLCREFGVNVIKIDGIEMVLEGEVIVKATKTTTPVTQQGITFTPGGITETTRIDTPDALTEEQLLMWSATGDQQ